MQPKLTPTTNDLHNASNGAIHGHTAPFAFPKIESFTSDVAPVTPVVVEIPQTPLKTESEPLKIAIIGTAPSSRHLAPYNDPSWKIWACSAGNQGIVPRVDAWFEIHSNLLWPENEHFGRPYLDWLNSQPFPLYMQDNSLVPRAIPLPKDDLLDEFGRFFFTSSFAWMMAFAIKQGAKEIGLWGVDMASRDEYILQRAGGHFFIQEAVRRGIVVHVPKESDLAQPPALYGFDDSTPFMRKLRVREKELKDRVGGMKTQRDQLVQNVTYLEGALEDIDYVLSIHGGVQSAGNDQTTFFGKPKLLQPTA